MSLRSLCFWLCLWLWFIFFSSLPSELCLTPIHEAKLAIIINTLATNILQHFSSHLSISHMNYIFLYSTIVCHSLLSHSSLVAFLCFMQRLGHIPPPAVRIACLDQVDWDWDWVYSFLHVLCSAWRVHAIIGHWHRMQLQIDQSVLQGLMICNSHHDAQKSDQHTWIINNVVILIWFGHCV